MPVIDGDVDATVAPVTDDVGHGHTEEADEVETVVVEAEQAFAGTDQDVRAHCHLHDVLRVPAHPPDRAWKMWTVAPSETSVAIAPAWATWSSPTKTVT